MQNMLKTIKNKVVICAFVINLIYFLFYSAIIFTPRSGFANIDLIINSYYFFPGIIFLVSFIFNTLKEKITFNILSLITLFILALYDFILPQFDLDAKILLFGFIVFPLLSASVSHLISKSYKKWTPKK